MLKKIFSVILLLAMLANLIPVSELWQIAHANEEELVIYDENGELIWFANMTEEDTIVTDKEIELLSDVGNSETFDEEAYNASINSVMLFSTEYTDSCVAYNQYSSPWGSYPYGYQNEEMTNPGTIGTSGCALLSLTNAVYALNGTFLDPTVLADYALSKGYRIHGNGTSGGFLKAYANAYGSTYGFMFVAQLATNNYNTVISYLNQGCVVIVNIPGHYMTIADYDSSTNKFLVLDSAPSEKRNTIGGKVWRTQIQLESLGFYSYYVIGPSTFSYSISDPSTYPAYPGFVFSQTANSNNTYYVKFIQLALNDLISAGLTTDGDFGTATETAVKSFQSKNGLDADGVVGSATWNKIVELLNQKYKSLSTPTITVTAGNNNESTEFSWNAVSNATNYKLSISCDGGEYTKNPELTDTSYSIVLPAGDYTASVTACNSSTSSTSKTVSFTVIDGKYIPVNTVYYDGHLYSIYDEYCPWTEARDICSNVNGYLATVTSQKEQDIISGLLESGTRAGYWLGATDSETEGTWKWITGEDFLYDGWNEGEPNDHQSNEDYMEQRTTSKWNDDNNYCNCNERGFICEIDASEWTPVKTAFFNGNKYELYNYRTPWFAAKVYAETIGGHLPYIESAEENAALFELLTMESNVDCWIGATSLDSSGETYTWLDGSELSFDNWYPGEPNNTAGNEYFADMQLKDGQWNNHNQRGGSNQGLWFIVEYENDSMSLTFDKTSANIELGETVQLTAQAVPEDMPYTWSSSNEDVATVSSDGRVTAKAVGSAVITVEYGDAAASCNVSVVNASTITAIEITSLPTKTSYSAGETIDTTGMIVTATYENGSTGQIYSGYELTYDFSSTGTKTVTVTYKEKTAAFTVTVNNDWITELPDGADPDDYETITQYSEREKTFTTSESSSIDGWTPYDSSTSYGDWSDWTDSEITKTDTLDVETRQVVDVAEHKLYHYGGWQRSDLYGAHYCETCAKNTGYSWVWKEVTLDYQLTAESKSESCGHVTNKYKYKYYFNSSQYYTFYDSCSWIETVPATYKTQYRFRSIDTTYYYYQWSDWSEWQDEAITATDTTEVRTRTLYRLKLVEEELVPLSIPTQFSGTSGKTEATIVFTPAAGGEAISAAVGYSSDIKGGIFSVELPEGEYSVKVTKPGHTTYTISSFTVGTDSVPQDIIIYAGDINGDGFINAKDNAILTAAFGSKASDESSGYNAAADFNEDGFINAKDRAVIIANFGKRNVTA